MEANRNDGKRNKKQQKNEMEQGEEGGTTKGEKDEEEGHSSNKHSPVNLEGNRMETVLHKSPFFQAERKAAFIWHFL